MSFSENHGSGKCQFPWSHFSLPDFHDCWSLLSYNDHNDLKGPRRVPLPRQHDFWLMTHCIFVRSFSCVCPVIISMRKQDIWILPWFWFDRVFREICTHISYKSLPCSESTRCQNSENSRLTPPSQGFAPPLQDWVKKWLPLIWWALNFFVGNLSTQKRGW